MESGLGIKLENDEIRSFNSGSRDKNRNKGDEKTLNATSSMNATTTIDSNENHGGLRREEVND